ncbi:MAG TPA: hypothetical protein DEQ02_00695, partial [Ruminococcaceae bacterium]|nr:hypothetical protein [Oscillospiraceae bacterium]
PPAVSGEFDGNCELATHKYYSWVMSGKDKPYKPGTGDMGDYTYTNGQTFPDGTTAKSTMPNKSPITMAKYVSDKSSYDAEPDGRWILDMDGWAYWSKLLPSGEATNLLLDEVIQTVAPDDNYAYFINVILQASNATEYLDLIDQGATGNGEDLIEKLATGTENLEMDIERWLEISEGEYRPGNVLFLIPGNKYQLNAFEPGTQIPIKNVTWRLTGESVPGVTLDSTGVLAIDSGVPTATVLTGIVTLNTNPIKKMTFTITI